LAFECRNALAAAGFEVESRRYHAHCTLGRPRVPWTETDTAAWVASATAAAGTTEVRFTARRLVLYESRSAPGGAVYTERSVLPLGPA
jgi:2'-5' RNA ligase